MTIAPERPNGGWGWVIVAGSLFVGVIVDGIKYSFGILFIELLDTFGGSRSETSWIISIQVGLSYFTGPVTGALVNRFGCRKVAAVGTLISFVGFVISPFATSFYYLYVSFGVLGGLGFGMMMLPFCVTIVHYFDKYLAFATGLSAMGPGLGTIIFNPLTKNDYNLQVLQVAIVVHLDALENYFMKRSYFRSLLDNYSWRGTLLVEAGLVLNGLVCAAILRMPDKHPDHVADQQTGESLLQDGEARARESQFTSHDAEHRSSYHRYDAPDDINEHHQDVKLKNSLIELQDVKHYQKSEDHHKTAHDISEQDNTKTHWLALTPLKNPGFLLLMLSTILIELSLIVPFSYLPDMMKMEGYSRPQAVWIIFIIGICSTISRVIAGALGDLKCTNRVVLCIIFIIWTGLAGFFPLCTDYTSYIVLAIVFGIGAGSSCSLRGVLIPELFGVDKIADCLGISMFFSGASGFISLPLAGLITDVSGNYTLSFAVAGVEMVSGGLLIAVILCCIKHRKI